MKSKIVFWMFIAIVMAITFTCCESKLHRVQHESSHDLIIDSVEQLPIPTLQEVLAFREEMRLDKYVDSVFLCMPEQILTQILVTKGTDLSTHEIVAIYIGSKDFYDNYVKKSMDIQKQYIPDSMPKPSIPEKNKNDSIRVKELMSFQMLIISF